VTRARAAALRLLFVVVGLLPWALASSHRAAAFFHVTFHRICHQRPERTLALLGAPMVVCSRCAGVFAGVAIGALIPLPPRLVPHGRALVLAALALCVIDVITQDLGIHSPSHPVRLVTGLLLGWTAAAFLFASVRGELASQHPSEVRG
jgi:uncharacterized membrane protein